MSLMSLTRYRRIFMLLGGTIFAFGAFMKLQSMRNSGPSSGGAHISMPAANPAEIWAAECASYACRDFHLEMRSCQSMCDRSLARGVPSKKPEILSSLCLDKCRADGTETSECQRSCFELSSAATAMQRH